MRRRESWLLFLVRACKQCGAKIPWGAPLCVECGSYTLWRDRLALFGILVGAGTVIVVIVSMARVLLAPPPAEVRAAGEVQELMERVSASDLRPFVAGAGRCKPEVAEALCLQTTPDLEELNETERSRVRNQITALWQSIAQTNPPRVVFVDPKGALTP